jgi:hypothetical protein
MPQYKVIAPGFFEGRYYHPEGKRKTLNTDTPFTKKNKMPSWLSEMPKETEAVKKKRLAYEKQSTDAAKAKADQDQKDIDNASFMGDGEAANTGDGIVENL